MRLVSFESSSLPRSFSSKLLQVLLRRETWSEKRRDERISAIDDMLAELCERNAIRPLALENLPGYQLPMVCLRTFNLKRVHNRKEQLQEPFDDLDRLDEEIDNILIDQQIFSPNILGLSLLPIRS